MSSEMTTALPSSLSGSESETTDPTPTNPDLKEAEERLDKALAEFVVAGNAFTEAGGNPVVIMQKFSAAVMGAE